MKTHANDAYPAVEVCKRCVEAEARALFAKEYDNSLDFDQADGWEQELFRRRAHIRLQRDSMERCRDKS